MVKTYTFLLYFLWEWRMPHGMGQDGRTCPLHGALASA